jgi:hypothetical protein
LRFGAGIKGKLVEAMLCGTPSVTTSIGAESMQGNCLEWFIADDVEVFSNQAVQLYQEKSFGYKRKKMIEIINSRYLRTLFEADFNSNIERLLTDLKQHRLYNFIMSYCNTIL